MKTYLNKLFVEISEELDLTQSQEGAIEKAYNAVSDWLNRNDSELNKFNIFIYPQGSMKLGTVVKPLVRDDYDVDMVCLLRNNTYGLSAEQVKKLVGNRLKANANYKQMLKPEGKRCWTLEYSESLNFHMDILPAIPNGKEAVKATHKDSSGYCFIPTNPHGYANWFKKCMLKPIVYANRGNIEELPEFPRKTPLQKVIQLLKRHRDVVFQNNQDVAPASIIITTIAANLYNHEIDYVELFGKVIKNAISQIENRYGVYWVRNPVNATENFADKWRTDKNKQKAFFDWLAKVKSDFNKLLASQTRNELLNCLYSMFGQKVVDLANNNLGGYDAIVPKFLREQAEVIPYDVAQALAVSHRQKARWELPSWSTVGIQATSDDGNIIKKIVSGEPLKKGLQLTFKAVHTTKTPYTVKWQITNTGTEARLKDCLRGDFYDSDSLNTRIESTSYRGIHFVQCFIIKKGQCVAKSKEFIVRIV